MKKNAVKKFFLFFGFIFCSNVFSQNVDFDKINSKKNMENSSSEQKVNLDFLKKIKYDFYVRIGSSGAFEEDVSINDYSFGGMYTTWGGSVTIPQLYNAQAVVKSKIKLSSAQCWDEVSTSSSWEKAWVAFDVPVFQHLRIFGGHGMSLALPGSFFNMTEEYADGTRWGKDGVSFNLSNDFISFGGNFCSTTTSANLKEKVQLGSGLSLDFKKFSIPLQLGTSVIYNNAKTYESSTEKKLSSKKYETESGNKTKIYESTTIYDYGNLFQDEYDYTSSIFAQFKPNKAITVSGGYTINGSAMTTSSTFKRVENYKTSDLEHSHIFSLISKWKISTGSWLNLSIEEEAEYAKAFKNDYYSLYGGLRLKQKIIGILHFYPSIQYFSIFNKDDSSFDRDSLVIYPRITLEKGHHYFVIGMQIEHREIEENLYHWQVALPLYYKFSL